MKAARSEPAERRPSLFGGQLRPRPLSREGTQEVSDSQGGRSLLPPPSSTSAPTTEGPRESPQTSRLCAPLQRGRKHLAEALLSSAGFRG